MKIPTTAGGRLMHSDNWKLIPVKREMAHVPGTNLNKEHKVKVVGDSHLRGTATKIDQYLNTKFKVCSWNKPGANTEELVDTLEKDLKCLGKKDVTVINGGANDIGSKRNQTNKVLVKVTQFMQKHNNTNIIVVKVNRKLNKTAKVFNHVATVETDLNRKYFT